MKTGTDSEAPRTPNILYDVLGGGRGRPKGSWRRSFRKTDRDTESGRRETTGQSGSSAVSHLVAQDYLQFKPLFQSTCVQDIISYP